MKLVGCAPTITYWEGSEMQATSHALLTRRDLRVRTARAARGRSTPYAWAATSALLSLLCVVACSSSSSKGTTPCNENPWECGSGQTCWPSSDTAFACLNSGAGQVGDSCFDSVGTPTCGDGLGCYQMAVSGGVCAAYCDPTDPSHACSNGICDLVVAQTGAETHLCIAAAPGDAGAD
jgi:hypothetical protein